MVMPKTVAALNQKQGGLSIGKKKGPLDQAPVSYR